MKTPPESTTQPKAKSDFTPLNVTIFVLVVILGLIGMAQVMIWTARGIDKGIRIWRDADNIAVLKNELGVLHDLNKAFSERVTGQRQFNENVIGHLQRQDTRTETLIADLKQLRAAYESNRLSQLDGDANQDRRLNELESDKPAWGGWQPTSPNVFTNHLLFQELKIKN